MSDKESSSNLKDIIDSTTGLVKAVPIYDDLIQPAAKEIGTALATVAKTVNLALAPVSGVIWSYETIKDFVSTKVSAKLKNVPPENIITPDPIVAGPALEALKYTAHESTLRELYANLLASALDSDTADSTHPSSVELIKQLSATEAQILNFLSNRERYYCVCSFQSNQTIREGGSAFGSEGIQSNQVKDEFIDLCEDFKSNVDIGSVLDNFLRLKILDIQSNTKQNLRQSWLGTEPTGLGETWVIDIEYTEDLIFTDFGMKFIDTCVKSKA